MFRLDNSFAQRPFSVVVVGCGGTGAFVAEGLCRFLPQHATLILIDHDRVEDRNLTRQYFFHDELGCFKSEALAKRIATKYARPVAYSVLPIALESIQTPGIVIGCVDNGLARREIESKVREGNALWWVDAGNGENYGQVVIGNQTVKGLQYSFDQEKALCFALPLPTLQRPELLMQRPVALNCAEALRSGDQGPVINQAMAVLALEVARKLIEGICPWMQIYLDLEAGTLHPVLATPEAVQRITAVKIRKLVRKGGEA